VRSGKTFCPHYLGGGIGLLASAHLLAGVVGDGLLKVDSNDNPLRERFCGPVSRAPRTLRRHYIATQACFVPATLCLAALVWLNETRPDFQLWGTVVFSSMSLLIAGRLAWSSFGIGFERIVSP
jgi:hypothetical protein